jgi:hypothetical protein
MEYFPPFVRKGFTDMMTEQEKIQAASELGFSAQDLAALKGKRIIWCPDLSGSNTDLVWMGDRKVAKWQTIQESLRSFVELMCLVDPSGVEVIPWTNSAWPQRQWLNLDDPDAVDGSISRLPLGGGTNLLPILEVLASLAREAARTKGEPIAAFVTTDGECFDKEDAMEFAVKLTGDAEIWNNGDPYLRILMVGYGPDVEEFLRDFDDGVKARYEKRQGGGWIKGLLGGKKPETQKRDLFGARYVGDLFADSFTKLVKEWLVG